MGECLAAATRMLGTAVDVGAFEAAIDAGLVEAQGLAFRHPPSARRTVTDTDGTERQILRDNMPFGTVGTEEFGTYFIGYARDPRVTEAMLERMFLGTATAAHDRILDFSTAVTATLFFTPSADFLEDPPEPPHSGS